MDFKTCFVRIEILSFFKNQGFGNKVQQDMLREGLGVGTDPQARRPLKGAEPLPLVRLKIFVTTVFPLPLPGGT